MVASPEFALDSIRRPRLDIRRYGKVALRAALALAMSAAAIVPIARNTVHTEKRYQEQARIATAAAAGPPIEQAKSKALASMYGSVKPHEVPPIPLKKVIDALAIQQGHRDNGDLYYKFIPNPAIVDLPSGEHMAVGGPGATTQIEVMDGDFALCGRADTLPHAEFSPLGHDNVHDGPGDPRIGRLQTSPTLPADCQVKYDLIALPVR